MPAYDSESLDMFRLIDPRKQYLNIAALYYRPWDPLTELIQNSLSSILERQKKEKSLRGQIRVIVDAAAMRITVEDNGIGFKTLQDLAANRTTRDIDNKTPHSGFGLGASSVLARSDYFSVRSVNLDREFHQAEWKDVYQRLNASTQPQGLPPDSFNGPRSVREEPKTVVEAGGADGFKELWKLAAEEPKRLYEILCAHTALRNVSIGLVQLFSEFREWFRL